MSSHPLEYAPRPPVHFRAVFVRWLALAVALAIAGSARWWEPPAWRHVELLYWQHRCMAYNAPAGQLVFESDPLVQVVPKEWSNFYLLFSPPGFVSEGTIFMHEMTTPDGHKRLVVVDYAPWLFGGAVQLSRVFVPGSAFRRPRESAKRRDLATGNGISIEKIFAGKLDPADPTHFSFRTVQGNQQIIYDGWLQNDDRVVIGPRK